MKRDIINNYYIKNLGIEIRRPVNFFRVIPPYIEDIREWSWARKKYENFEDRLVNRKNIINYTLGTVVIIVSILIQIFLVCLGLYKLLQIVYLPPLVGFPAGMLLILTSLITVHTVRDKLFKSDYYKIKVIRNGRKRKILYS